MILTITDLSVRYGRQHVLTGASLEVESGEVVGVIGETGSGKSTLARAVLGLVRPSAGRIVIDGQDVTHHRERQWRALRRRGVVQYVFQDPLRSLDPDLSIADSLAEPLLLVNRSSPTVTLASSVTPGTLATGALLNVVTASMPPGTAAGLQLAAVCQP